MEVIADQVYIGSSWRLEQDPDTSNLELQFYDAKTESYTTINSFGAPSQQQLPQLPQSPDSQPPEGVSDNETPAEEKDAAV